MQERFSSPVYSFQSNFVLKFGASITVSDGNGVPVLYAEQKAFRLKEDLRLYADNTKAQELITVSERGIIGFAATYDVIDAPSGAKIGAVRREGFKSVIRDTWLLLDPADQVIGKLQEASLLGALARRAAGMVADIPLPFMQGYLIELDGKPAAALDRTRNILRDGMTLRITDEAMPEDRRKLLLALGMVLTVVEGKQ